MLNKKLIALLITTTFFTSYTLPSLASNNVTYRLENNTNRFFSDDNMLALASTTESQKILAISDFANNTGDSKLDYLKDAITDSLITSLVSNSNSQLSIVERSQFKAIVKEMGFANTGLIDVSTATKLGNALGASQVIVGSLAKAGNVLRLNVRVIDVKTAKVLFAFSEDGESEKEIFNLVDNISEKIVPKLLNKKETIANNVEKNIENKPKKNTSVTASRSQRSSSIFWVGSIFIPGLGQLMMGEPLSAFSFFGSTVLFYTLGLATTPSLSSGDYTVAFLMYTCYFILYIWNIIDAFILSNPSEEKEVLLNDERLALIQGFNKISNKIETKNGTISYKIDF